MSFLHLIFFPSIFSFLSRPLQFPLQSLVFLFHPPFHTSSFQFSFISCSLSYSRISFPSSFLSCFPPFPVSSAALSPRSHHLHVHNSPVFSLLYSLPHLSYRFLLICLRGGTAAMMIACLVTYGTIRNCTQLHVRKFSHNTASVTKQNKLGLVKRR